MTMSFADPGEARRPQAASVPLVDVRDYRLVFNGFEGTNHVLDGIDLRVSEGEAVGIVGETGCGKSVLGRSLLRLNDERVARVASGEIRFAGENIFGFDRARLARLRGVDAAMIFQDPTSFLNPVFTIGEQITAIMRAKDRAQNVSRSRERLRADAIAILSVVQLREPERVLDSYPHQLSGGMRQRILIAMAITGRPRLLVADEPTTALDVVTQMQILLLIRELVGAQQMSLLLISHDLDVIGMMCERVVVMYAGTIVEDAPTAELLARPRHPYTKALLAAIPRLDAPDRRLESIPGGIPNLLNPPQGCRFQPRCPLATDICRRTKPALREAGAGHRVACHMVDAA